MVFRGWRGRGGKGRGGEFVRGERWSYKGLLGGRGRYWTVAGCAGVWFGYGGG